MQRRERVPYEYQSDTQARAQAAGLLLDTLQDRFGVALALFALYVIWGSTYLAIRFTVEGFPPFLAASARFLVAGSILYLFLRLRGGPNPTLAQWAGSAAVGVLLLLGGNGLVSYAEKSVLALAYLVVFGSLVAFSSYAYLLRNVRPALATSYAYVNPVVAVLLGIALAGERLSAKGIAALLVILTGVALVVMGREAKNPQQIR